MFNEYVTCDCTKYIVFVGETAHLMWECMNKWLKRILWDLWLSKCVIYLQLFLFPPINIHICIKVYSLVYIYIYYIAR